MFEIEGIIAEGLDYLAWDHTPRCLTLTSISGLTDY